MRYVIRKLGYGWHVHCPHCGDWTCCVQVDRGYVSRDTAQEALERHARVWHS